MHRSIEQQISDNRAFLMGISILSIMLFHQSWIWGWNPFFAFFHLYGNWGVDVFFFVSGFGLYYSLKKDGNVLSFYKRRITRIMPLCVVCGLLHYIADHILPIGQGGYPTGIHPITTDWMTILSFDRWFIPVILVYYLVMPILFWAINKYGKIIMICVYLIAITGVFYFALSQYTSRFPSFCLGVIAAAGMIRITTMIKFLGVLAILTAMVYKLLLMRGLLGIHEDGYTYIILSFGIIVLCYLLLKINVCALAEKMSVVFSPARKSLCFLGKHTLELYLVHETVYRYTYRFLIDTSIPLTVQILVALIISMIVAVMLGHITNRALELAQH